MMSTIMGLIETRTEKADNPRLPLTGSRQISGIQASDVSRTGPNRQTAYEMTQRVTLDLTRSQKNR